MNDKDAYIIKGFDRLHDRLERIEDNQDRYQQSSEKRFGYIEAHYAQKTSWKIIAYIVASFTAILTAFASIASLFKH